MNELIGRIVAKRYRVEIFLGKGGMAEVYQVWDQVRSVPLAMKLLHADMAEDKIFLRRFKREAQTLERLQHPNIVRFYGLEQADGLVFILMDYVEGTTLRKEIFEYDKPFVNRRVLEIMRPICAALHYAHQSGIVHCDVKPANIMLHKNGAVLVSDFGIARMSESATMTMAGAGTPAYMSPEQVRGDAPIPQMDVYALGVILYELLTGGERPFTGENSRTTGTTSEKIRWEQTHLEPPSPRIYNPDISPVLEKLILRSLSKEPEKRPLNMQVIIGELEHALATESTPEAPQPIPSVPPAPKYPPDITPIPPHPRPVPMKPGLDFTNLPFRLLKSIPRWGRVALGVLIIALPVILLMRSPASIEGNGGFYFYSDREGQAQIYHLDPEGQITQITSVGNNFSPMRGMAGLYFTSDRSGKLEIYYMDDKGHTKQVTHTPGDGGSWEPVPYEGGIYFVSNRSGKSEIYFLDGPGEIKQVTSTPANAISDSPAPTIQGLYFTSNRSGKSEIFFMDGNGQIKQITSTHSVIGSGMADPIWNGFYFASDRDGENFEIYHMNTNGMVVQVTHTLKNVANINPIAVSSGLYFVSDRTGMGEIYHLDHLGILRQITHSPPGSSSMIGMH